MKVTFMTDDTNQKIDNNKIFLSVMNNKYQESYRPSGLVTEQDVFSIKGYVREALGLPVTESEFNQRYGKIPAGGAVDTKKILALNAEMRAHAYGWSALEVEMIDLGSVIKTASSDIKTRSTSILNLLSDLVMIVKAQLDKDGIPLQGAGNLNLTPPQMSILKTIPDVMKFITQSTTNALNKVVNTKNNLIYFRNAVSGGEVSGGKNVEGLSAKIKKLRILILNEQQSGLGVELRNEINNLQQLYENLDARYSEYVRNAGLFAIGGPLILLIGGSIYGKLAEDARQERNEVSEKIKKLTNQLNTFNALLAVMVNLDTTTLDISSRLTDVEVASNDFIAFWSNNESIFNSIMSAINNISTVGSLLSFEIEFKTVHDYWLKAGGETTEFLTVLKNAIEKFKG